MVKNTLARDLMKQPVRQLQSTAPVRHAAAFLLRHGISGAPVLDEHGRWMGVFTQNDLARFVERRIVPPKTERTLEAREADDVLFGMPPDRFGETPVREFMTAGMFTVFPESTVEEVIHTLTANRIHRVFVIEEKGGALLGVITTMDVLRWMDRRHRAGKKRTHAVRK
jgi:CBS-domain-containing membrane protein